MVLSSKKPGKLCEVIPQKLHPLFSSSRVPGTLGSRVYFLFSPNSDSTSPSVWVRSLLCGMVNFTQRRSTPFRVWGLSSPCLGPHHILPFPRPDTLQSRPGRLSPAPTSAPPAAETSLLPPRSTWDPAPVSQGWRVGRGAESLRSRPLRHFALCGRAGPLPGRRMEGLKARAAPAAGAGTHLLWGRGSVYNYCPPPRQRRQPGDRPRWRWRRGRDNRCRTAASAAAEQAG